MPHPDESWVEVGNLFSNFYEEIIYRGFLLVAVHRALSSRWAAVLATGLLFGLLHLQYPLSGRILLSIQGFVAAFVYFRTGSLWACWLNHQVMDILMGTFFSG